MGFFETMDMSFIQKARFPNVVCMVGVSMTRKQVLCLSHFLKETRKDKRKKLKLALPMKARNQIFKLFQKYSEVYHETDETGWYSTFSTEEYVFRDISRFYKPMCYDANGNYAETSNMEQFILHNSPFCVFDAVEFLKNIITLTTL